MKGNEGSPKPLPDDKKRNAACLYLRYLSNLAERLNPRRLIAPIRRIELKAHFPKSSQNPREPMMVNGGLPLARSSNLAGNSSIGQNFINLVSDDEDDVYIPDKQDLEASKRKGRLLHKSSRIKAEQEQPNGPREARNSNASSSKVDAQTPIKDAAEPNFAFRAFARGWEGDFIHDDAFDDPELADLMMDQFNDPPKDQVLSGESLPDRDPRPYLSHAHNNASEEHLFNLGPTDLKNPLREEVIRTVRSVFPDMCQDYLDGIYNDKDVAKSSDGIIAHILDQTEKGKSYPRSKDKQKNLKRKRKADGDNASAVLKYESDNRPPVRHEARMIT
jgi:hypothetical protein